MNWSMKAVATAGLKLFDCHCHLQDPRIFNQVSQLISSASSCGVLRFAVNGTSEKDWNVVNKMGEDYPSVIPCFGLHPWYVSDRTPHWFTTLRDFLLANPTAALGEVGLDKGSHGKNIDFNDQVEVCTKQLELAKEFRRPVSVHCVRAFGDLLRIMMDMGPFKEGLILHSYMGSVEMVKEMAKLGAYFSFSGFITSMKVDKAKKLLKTVPIDKILLETDAPDALPLSNLGPLCFVERNMPTVVESPSTTDVANHPSNILEVLRYVAWLLGMSVEEVAQNTYRNSVNLFSFEGSKVSN